MQISFCVSKTRAIVGNFLETMYRPITLAAVSLRHNVGLVLILIHKILAMKMQKNSYKTTTLRQKHL